ncbi:DsbA family protein [Abyssibius alkaniclasticus]|uniref:DsbA family protein n=1 Tax=Abyssibius alkaniclasticus TaxID=2881234 RepID=UPI0023633C1D|nr:DsbA family protein [Abyssibius alkaniclasticus]UPH71667.1 DsbA family protein [Abyssibius alkaniclasticus]
MKLSPLMGRRAALGMMGAGLASASAMPLLAQEADAPDTTQTPVQTPVREVVEMVMGAADAPIELIEYASFTCPHCMRFHQEVFPQLRADYIDTGKVRLIYRPVYFDGPGLWADMMARCGGPEKFFGIVSILYEQQSSWARGATGAEVAQSLVNIGKLAGMSEEDITACMQDRAFAEALIADFQANMARDDVPGTPTFFVNGEQMTNSPYETFVAKFDGLLGE